ncbi:hypothetical protein WKW77_20200 [Variovorax ureilyticus]|uniref:HTH marR-type domain-containing protein n=1 Tax=Variovorax ureilyticus TaxID=1836198 RepID=A0ABU8VIC4_9BURK
METVKEFFDAIKGQLSERLANPFTGAFCIAWVILNFRLLMVFAGTGTYQEKFAYIDASLYPDWRHWALRGLVVPMATAAMYLLAYPWATTWLAEHYRKQQTKANNLMKAAEGTALLSKEESRALHVRLAEAEQRSTSERDSFIKELEARRNTIADLARERDALRDEVLQLRAVHGDPENQMPSPSTVSETPPGADDNESAATKLERARFKLVASDAARLPRDIGSEQYSRPQLVILSILREGNRLPTQDLTRRMQLPAFDVQRTLDRLRDLKLVGYDSNGEWFITADGRALLGAFVDANRWNFANDAP